MFLGLCCVLSQGGQGPTPGGNQPLVLRAMLQVCIPSALLTARPPWLLSKWPWSSGGFCCTPEPVSFTLLIALCRLCVIFCCHKGKGELARASLEGTLPGALSANWPLQGSSRLAVSGGHPTGHSAWMSTDRGRSCPGARSQWRPFLNSRTLLQGLITNRLFTKIRE